MLAVRLGVDEVVVVLQGGDVFTRENIEFGGGVKAVIVGIEAFDGDLGIAFIEGPFDVDALDLAGVIEDHVGPTFNDDMRVGEGRS